MMRTLLLRGPARRCAASAVARHQIRPIPAVRRIHTVSRQLGTALGPYSSRASPAQGQPTPVQRRRGRGHRYNSSSASAQSEMADEYGTMDDSGKTYAVQDFHLESGVTLESAQVRYKTWGTLNEARDNVLFVCHALTGNASLDSWWGTSLGDGRPFDTSKYYVVCANVLGSCYGTTGPTTTNPTTGKHYGPEFPYVTVRDTVRLHWDMLREAEGVDSVKCVVGGSMGGMQTLEWLFLEEGGARVVDGAVVIACGLHHHAWQIGVSETQRQAIYADPKFMDGWYDLDEPPTSGLGVARQIAMISYRSHAAYESKFGRTRVPPEAGRKPAIDDPFQVTSYLEYQGEKFNSRFDANSYIALTKLMDSHDIGRGRGGSLAAAASIEQPVHVIGIDSDVLYPISEQEAVAAAIPDSSLSIVRSDDGHDGFLLAQDAIGPQVEQFLRSL